MVTYFERISKGYGTGIASIVSVRGQSSSTVSMQTASAQASAELPQEPLQRELLRPLDLKAVES